MGRDLEHMAMEAGIAGSADAILIPELTPVLNEDVIMGVCRHIGDLQQNGRRFASRS